MTTYLHIAGHGMKRNGSFDHGATGYILQGEHKYYAELFFERLKKYQPKHIKAIYHTAYNVYDYGNLVSLARKYGKDTIVIEWHYDAGSPSASGGHVIIYSGYSPDKIDLAIRDAIKQMVGVRYSHKGHEGISGRNNLANVNRAANGGINYRLVELAFGTNKRDSEIMTKKIDEFARVMTEKLYNVDVKKDAPTPPRDSNAGYHIVKVGDTLWGIATANGMTVDELKKLNGLKSNTIFPNQSLRVDGSDTPAPKPAPKPKNDSPAQPSNDITVGSWIRVPAGKLYASGNATTPTKSKELSAQVETINSKWRNEIRLKKNGAYIGFARRSDIIGGSSGVTGGQNNKSIQTIAQEVIDGKWGNNPQRKQRLEQAGYNYNAVQQEVNRIMKGKTTPSKPKTFKVGQTVTVKPTAKTYATGETIASHVKGKSYKIKQVKSDRVLLDGIMSWVRKSDVN